MFKTILEKWNQQDFLPRINTGLLKLQTVSCHHNYISLENHYGKNLYICRKGAISAKKDEYGIIPGSMGTETFIVKGKGNPESFYSASHGAGRTMSRKKAKQTITLEQHEQNTRNVVCDKSNRVLDESPEAYKNIIDVMEAQEDLVDIEYVLRQLVNVKG
jgi:tRNA-splicing ligase RtcB